MSRRHLPLVALVSLLAAPAFADGHRAKASLARFYLFASELGGWTVTGNVPIPWCSGYGSGRSCDDHFTSVVATVAHVSGEHTRAGTRRDLDLWLVTAGIRFTPWAWHSRGGAKRLIPFFQLRGGLAGAEETIVNPAPRDWAATVDGALGFEVPISDRLRIEAEGDVNCRWNFGRECAPGVAFGVSFVF